MANRITTVLEFIGADKASNQVKNLGKEFQKAEGFAAKSKVAFKGAGDILKNNMAEAAAVAGTAIVAFGVKSVQAFSDSAIAAGKFSDATGLAVEDASRWQEVADDIGVSGETLTGLFTRMNKAIGSNAPVVQDLGIKLMQTADGATDVSATMLGAIDAINRIEDPTKRAEAAQKLFGRSYAEAAELIFDSADNVQKKLAEVSDAKVIDEAELEKARRLRESMDNLRDAIDDATLAFGEALTPTVAETADNLVWLKEQFEKLGGVGGGAIGEATDAARMFLDPLKQVNTVISKTRGLFGDTADATEEAAAAINEYDGATDRAAARTEVQARRLEEMEWATRSAADAQEIIAEEIANANREFDNQQEAAQRARDALRDHADAVYGLYDAEAALANSIADANEVMAEIANGEFEGSQYDARDALTEVAKAADEAAMALVESKDLTIESEAGQREWTRAMLATAATLSGPMRQEVLNHISRVTGIPTDVLTKFDVEMDYGALAKIQADLDAAARTRFVRFSATGTAGGAIIDGGDTGPRTRTGVGATGGIVTRPTRAIIGEAGPEAVIPLNQMPGASPLPGGANGGVTVHIHAMGTTPELERVVANALERYNKRNGRG